MQPKDSFPLKGVIGVVANSADEIAMAAAKGLQCVELRADLLLDTGLTLNEVLDTIQQAKNQGLASLFTLRHPTHGGKFSGTEDDRVSINQQALAAGADIIDLEWNTDSATQMLATNAPIILSYHDFNAMPTEAELAELTEHMQSGKPLAVKVVPTASTLSDAVKMLQWVADAENDIRRIGFAMGQTGACSRILTIAHGAPITYASFGEAVAPGQVAIDELLTNYRAMSLDSETTVIAIAADSTQDENTASTLNRKIHTAKKNQVAIAFEVEQINDLNQYKEPLRITEIQTSH